MTTTITKYEYYCSNGFVVGVIDHANRMVIPRQGFQYPHLLSHAMMAQAMRLHYHYKDNAMPTRVNRT